MRKSLYGATGTLTKTSHSIINKQVTKRKREEFSFYNTENKGNNIEGMEGFNGICRSYGNVIKVVKQAYQQ